MRGNDGTTRGKPSQRLENHNDWPAKAPTTFSHSPKVLATRIGDGNDGINVDS